MPTQMPSLHCDRHAVTDTSGTSRPETVAAKRCFSGITAMTTSHALRPRRGRKGGHA